MPLILKAEEQSLTLDEALAIGLRDNRDILLKEADIKKAKKKIAEAESGLFPALSFTGKWTDTTGYYAKDLSQAAALVNLKQYLYKGARVINTISQDKYKLEVSRSLLDKAKLELILNMEKAFLLCCLPLNSLILIKIFWKIQRSTLILSRNVIKTAKPLNQIS
ncbi:MAG: TolC family protein [Candidatus Omnitrophota bacterium]|nr:TolC family protein [Candidatus Omnitrophota bacterium]